MENKIKLIDEIIKRHPSYGTKKGWSYYVGGMKDTGEWYFRKMLDVPIEELQSFLDNIIVEENKPKRVLTEQELADSERYIVIEYEGKKSWMNLLEYKSIAHQIQEGERKTWFGE